jgi:hypothetical protein
VPCGHRSRSTATGQSARPTTPRPGLDAPSTRPSVHAAHAVRHDDFADIHAARGTKPTTATWTARSEFAWLAIVAACAGAPQPLTEPSPPAALGQLVVTGLQRATTLTIADLEALGAEDVPWTFRDEPHVYRAVALDRVLTHCGFEEGPGGRSIPPTERRPGWREIVIAQASDGVVAVFTCAELMPQMGRTRAFVAWAVDGAELPADEGPLRIVVTSDQKGSRSLRQVVDVRVFDVRGVQARDQR